MRFSTTLPFHGSLQETASKAVALAGPGTTPHGKQESDALAAKICAQLSPSQRYIRGLYSGGTFCLEAQLILRDAGIQTYSNAPLADGRKLVDVEKSSEHTVIDLGSDEFTVGRPHPMIDYGARIDRLLKDVSDAISRVRGRFPLPAGVGTDEVMRDVRGAKDTDAA